MFTAIANQYNLNQYGGYSSAQMKDGKENKNTKKTETPYEFKEIPKKNGKPDYSQVPEGAILYKKGHVGLYIGNQREISAKTTNNGEHTSSSARDTYMNAYTHYALIPFVDYSK